MKKAVFVGVLVLMALLRLACGPAQASGYDAFSSASMSLAPVKSEPTKVRLDMNGAIVRAVLYDNAAARSFLGLLPYTVTVSRAPDDLCGTVTDSLAADPAEDRNTWAIGEIGWFDGWFTILCDNEADMPKRPRTIIGKIVDEDIRTVQSLRGTFRVVVTAAR